MKPRSNTDRRKSARSYYAFAAREFHFHPYNIKKTLKLLIIKYKRILSGSLMVISIDRVDQINIRQGNF